MKIFVAFLGCLFLLSGCVSVKVSNIDSQEYLIQRRGDVITQGRLSEPSNIVLTSLGLSDCEYRFQYCIKEVVNSSVTDSEEKLSTLSEMWLYYAMRMQKESSFQKQNGDYQDEQRLTSELLNAYLEAARYSYAYLFFSERGISSRALEDRQTQVKDYYNFAVQNVIEQLFRTNKGKSLKNFPIKEGNWQISIRTLLGRQADPRDVEELIPDTVLSFDGLKNQYTNDGLGARMVLSFKEELKTDQPWRLMPYSSVTAMITFPGGSLAQILSTRNVMITAYDPAIVHSTTIGKNSVPLSANFSGAYGLWLANSDFAVTSLSTIFGKGTIIDRPTVYLMREYRKDLRTIILIHGLASSPEAWVNTANEIMGDKVLRDNYQIWQVYYPTNIPLLINRYEIANAINKTIEHFDPERKNPASRDITLVGHSMGGVLTRLLVSEPGTIIVEEMGKLNSDIAKKKKVISSKYGSMFEFKPLRGVTEAIFLAAPHRGTPFADSGWARYLASFVKLPMSIVNTLGEMTLTVFGHEMTREISMTGIDNLSAKDPMVLILQKIPISQKVKYYSIIGREDPKVPLEESSDGIVPYVSAHLSGARSEKVIESGHSVQETPEAIVEIRKILRNSLVRRKN